MIVILAPAVVSELAAIWCWDGERRCIAQADACLAFIRGTIDALATAHGQGRPVVGRLDLKHVVMQWRQRRHGHVAVYAVEANAVNIVNVFHTAQDWQSRAARL